MSDAAIFVSAFVVLLVLRITGATVVFFYLLPRGDRCPICDDSTLRIQHRGWNTLAPWFRTSWCPGCGWAGLLRFGPLALRESVEPAAAGQREHGE